MSSLVINAYDALVLRKPKLVLVLLLSILAFFAYHTKDFKLDASADALLLEDDADLDLFRKIHNRYPTNDLMIVTYTPDKDLFSESALEPLKRLREELRKVSIVDSVFSILDAPLFKSSNVPIQELLENIPSLETDGIDRDRAKDELVNSPIYRELIISADGQTTALLLSLTEEKEFNSLLKSRNNMRAKRRNAGLSAEETKTL
ncbi:MAG: hypothetical protein V3R37_04025, partial [Rhodospirillales bacterium]